MNDNIINNIYDANQNRIASNADPSNKKFLFFNWE